MTFKEFEKEYFKELDISPNYLRKGQVLMNFLADKWFAEYKRLSSLDYYSQTDIDCFYNDRLIPNTLKHLGSVWDNYPN